MQPTNDAARRDASPLGRGEDLRYGLLDLWLGGCCAFLLMGLVALTVVDVVGRYVLTAPLPGAFELTELMLGALVFAALPLATKTGEHVAVDALFDASPRRLRTALDWLGGLASAVALWVIAWRLAVYSVRLANDEAVTDALLVPLAPLGWLAAGMAALSGLLAVARLVTRDDDEAPGIDTPSAGSTS